MKIARLVVLLAMLLSSVGFVSSTQTPPTMTATPQGQSVSLSWTASSTGGVAGYNVYKSTSPGEEVGTNPINTNLITGTTYTDTQVASGQTYFYIVKAFVIATPITVQITGKTINGMDATITAVYNDATLSQAGMNGVQTVYQLWANNRELTSGKNLVNTGAPYAVTWTGPKAGTNTPILTVSDSNGWVASTFQQSLPSNEASAVIP